MNTRAFLLTDCSIRRRDQMEDIHSGLKYETLTVNLEFISSGKTPGIPSELIIADISARLNAIPDPFRDNFRVSLDTRRLVRMIVIDKKNQEMRELINNTSADDLRSSLGCSYNPERSSDLNLDLEVLEKSLRDEQSNRKRPTVIKILESRIKKYRRFIKRNPKSI